MKSEQRSGRVVTGFVIVGPSYRVYTHTFGLDRSVMTERGWSVAHVEAIPPHTLRICTAEITVIDAGVPVDADPQAMQKRRAAVRGQAKKGN